MRNRMAILVVLVLVLATVAVPLSADPVQTYFLNNYDTAPSSNGPGHLFTYESLVQSPGDSDGIVYTDWWYDYYLENNSTNHSIVSWTFTTPFAGTVMSNPGNNPNYGSWPLPPSSGPGGSQTSFREESFSHLNGFIEVASVIEWNDGYRAYVPVYTPVPEPSGLLACASLGLTGLAGTALRRLRCLRKNA